MFRTLLKKELREHIAVAAAGFAAGALAMAVHLPPPISYEPQLLHASMWTALTPGATWPYVSRELVIPLGDAYYLGKLTYVCYGLALALGFLMSWKETVRQTWAFLQHRPTWRGQVLTAKLLAGAILYVGPLLPPFLFLAYWSSVPGHYPGPWAIELVYPGLETMTRGYVLFLGAFLCGIRPARWYATRFVPLAGAIVLVAPTAWSQYWVTVCVFTLLAVIVQLCAIWHVFTNVKWLRVALLVQMSLGITGGLFAVCLPLKSIFIDRMRPTEWIGTQFSDEGDPQFVVQRSGGGRTTLKRLDGKVLAEGVRYDDKRLFRSASLGASAKPWRPSSRRPPVSLLKAFFFVDRSPEEPLIYILWKESRLSLYDWRSRKAVGYWGEDGFVSERAAASTFPRIVGVERLRVAGRGVTCIASEGGVFWLDESDEKITKILGTAALSIDTPRNEPKQEGHPVLYVRGPGYVTVLEPEGKNPRRFLLPERLDTAKWFRARLVEGDLLGVIVRLADMAERSSARSEEGEYLCKLDPSGSVLWEHTRTKPSSDYLRAVRMFYAIIPGGCPLFAIGSPVGVMALEGRGDEWRTTILAPILVRLALCAIVTFLILSKRGLTVVARLAWSGFALLGGVGAVLAIWAELLSEKRIPCPACGRKRPPSMPNCPHCAADWPAPARRDIDILAPRR